MSINIHTTLTPYRSRFKDGLIEWTRDWGGKLTVVFGLFVVLHVLYLFFRFGGEEYTSLISNIVSSIIYAGPSLLAWRASRHPSLSSRTRWAWLLISLACLAYTVGSILWLYFENILGEQPFPSWADVWYLAFYPLMMAGLLLLVEKMRSAEERLNFFLDSGVILVGGGMVLWYFLLRPIAQSYTGDTLTTVLSLAYPIADLILLLGISSLMLRPTTLSSGPLNNLLLFGLVINFLADFLFGYQTLAGTYHSGDLVDGLFTLSCLPMMLAAHAQQIIASREALPRPVHGVAMSRYFWVPYAAVAVVYLVLLQMTFERDTEHAKTAILVAGCVTALVILRQFMFVRANTKADHEVDELQQRIQGIYSASIDAIGLADFTGTITEVNESFVRLTGHRRDEIVGKMNFHDFVSEDYLDRSVTPEMAMDSGRPIEYERELIRKDGTARTVTTTLYAVNGAQGTPGAMAVVVRDITDRRSLELQLTRQALHDSLTGLANRALLSDRVTAALGRNLRRNSKSAVLFLDLDNFKIVNDTLGHAAGDSLLNTVADRLRSCLRASDLAARLGGDEFAILIEDIERAGEEIYVADRILTALRAPINIGGKEVFVGASIGIALSSPSIKAPEDLLRNADAAMYTAKKEGKNRYSVYKETPLADVIQLETELHSATEKKGSEIYHQPTEVVPVKELPA